MTVAMRAVTRASGPLALRVAIVRGGSIEREWFVKEGEVTFGSALDADVVVPGAAVTRATLFEVGEEATKLFVPEGVAGRALVGREQLELTEARTIELDDSARGRVLLAGHGDAAIAVLFQRVPAPAERTKPSLPASVRGGLLDRVDWLFTAIAAASFMTHFAVVIGLQSADFPMPPSLAEIDDRYAEVLLTDATPPPPPVVDDDDPSRPAPTQDDPTPSPTEPTHVASPTRSPSHGPSSAPSAEEQAAIDAVARAEATHAVTELIGHIGAGGALADVIRNGGPTDSAAEVLATVDGVQVASRDPGAMAIRTGHPSGTEHGLEGLRTATGPVGPREEGHELAERPVHVQVDPIIDDPMEPTFDQRALVAAIRHRLPAIQRCYEMQLSHSPGLEGRLTVSMQVEQVGSLSHVAVTDDTVGSRPLDECVVNNIRSIRLATGPSEAVTVEYPLVFAPQS